MDYKFSIYNIIFEYKDLIYVYNTFTGSLCSFEKSEHEQIFGNKNFSRENLEKLINQGLLVDSELNEFNRSKIKHIGSKYNNTSRILNIVIAPTSICNLKCIYCFQDGNVENLKINQKTQDGIVSFIGELIEKYAIKKLKIQWFGGEPMIAFNEIRYLSNQLKELCLNKNVDYFSSMITNGTLLNDKILAELMELGIKKIQITLDGTEKNYCLYKSATKQQHEDLIKNLKKLPNELAVSLRLNCDKNNYQDIKKLCKTEIFDIIQKRNINVYLGRIERTINDKNYSDSFNVDEFNKIKLDFDNFLKINKIRYPIRTLRKSSYCGFCSLYSLGIDSQGYLYNCEREIGDKNCSIGTVWTGINYNEKYLDFIFQETPFNECSSCKFYPLCYGGCPKHFAEGIKDCQITEKQLVENLKNKIDLYSKKLDF